MRELIDISCVLMLFFIALPGRADPERLIEMSIADSLFAGAREDRFEASPEKLCSGLNRLATQDSLNCSAQSTENQRHDLCSYVKKLLQKCIQIADKRRSIRLSNLGRMSKSSLENIPDCCRLPEEDQRLALLESQEIARFKQERVIIDSQKESVRGNRQIMVPVLSETLCELKSSEREARVELNDRLRSQKYSSITDAGISYAQSELNRVLERKGKVQAELSRFHVAPLSCKSQTLRILRTCQHGSLFSSCQTLNIKLLIETFDNYRKEIYG